jgi:hypothetical protein
VWASRHHNTPGILETRLHQTVAWARFQIADYLSRLGTRKDKGDNQDCATNCHGSPHNYVKEVKDRGLLAGVSAHNPNVIKQIANEGWEVDFFMTCFYFLTRNLEKEETMPIIPVGSYNFFKDDPRVMTQVIRQVKQPCLAFKILGAGRLCSSEEKVRAAFQFAFENIKPTDGVIVGMFPWFFDEIGANVQYAQEFGI